MFTDREKIKIISGRSFWTFGLENREEMPVLRVSDGPAGLRIPYKDQGYDERIGSRPSLCYPSAAACACSFDTDLMKKMGKALGSECRKNGVAVLLGPALNIKRNPLCGRNFEYYSEDPVLSGLMAAAYVKGVQSTGTGACIKHFAANSQETRRAKSNSVMDPGTLFDIYLKGFEIAIRESDPAMVMLAYNKLNGIYCCEHEWLLRNVLREEMGFQGVCVSDWGAVNRVCTSFNAGLDLRMPGGVEGDEEYLMNALKSGKLKREALDRAVTVLENFAADHKKACRKSCRYDKEKNRKTAERMARSSVVLLKNEGAMPIPLKKKILVVGEMAKFPKYIGGGSGKVKLSYAVTPWSALKVRYPDLTYSRGYVIFGEEPSSGILINKACEAAKKAESVIVFAGLPENAETEGVDRNDLDLPAVQNELISRLAAVNPEISVVVSAGSAVLMPWADMVKSIFMCYPLGSCTGDALADLITGRGNPSGKLSETFPLKMSDLPSFKYFPARDEKAVYREGKYYGYRYFNASDRNVLFPFGHGLSYTEFQYEDLKIKTEDDRICISVRIVNTGKRKGSEAVQFYVSHESEDGYRELAAFAKVSLKPGEAKEVHSEVLFARLAVFDEADSSRVIRNGRYRVYAAASSTDIRLYADVVLAEEMRHVLKERVPEPFEERDPRRYTRNISLSDLEKIRMFRPLIRILKSYLSRKKSGLLNGCDLYTAAADIPIRQLPMGTNGRISAYGVKKTADMMEKLFHKEIHGGHTHPIRK